MSKTTTAFPFDNTAFADYWNPANFAKMFSGQQMPEFDTKGLMATQKKNMDALVAANKAAADAYQDLFKKQLEIFENTVAEASKQVSNFDASDMTPEGAKAKAELAQVAVEKAMNNMKVFAEEAQKANTDAYAKVSARVEASAQEFAAMAKKMTK